jgi:hypothetical protein
MAISVNTVYQTVLSILNKEQRGYLTPDEYNKIGAQAQLEIFESYFPSGDQFNRKNQNNSQNDTEWFNIYDNVITKLEPFIYRDATWQNASSFSPYWALTPEAITALDGRLVKQVGNVEVQYNTASSNNSSNGLIQTSICERISKKEYNLITRSRLTAPSVNDPVYYVNNFNLSVPNLRIYPNPTPSSISIANGLVTSELIVQPLNPQWNYTIDPTVGAYIYNDVASVDFELNPSEQTDLILKILLYAGVVIRDPQIIQAAATEIQKEEIQEKS